MFGDVLFVYLFDIKQVLTAKCELCWSVGGHAHLWFNLLGEKSEKW